MAKFLANQIIKGYLTYSKVPETLKPEVAMILKEMEYDDLIIL